MATDFHIIQGARLPSIEVQAFDRDGPLDLSAATSPVFYLSSPDDGQVVNGSTAVIVDGPAGILRYDWGASDTATPGSYRAQFAVTINSLSMRVPSNGHITIVVHETA